MKDRRAARPDSGGSALMNNVVVEKKVNKTTDEKEYKIGDANKLVSQQLDVSGTGNFKNSNDRMQTRKVGTYAKKLSNAIEELFKIQKKGGGLLKLSSNPLDPNNGSYGSKQTVSMSKASIPAEKIGSSSIVLGHSFEKEQSVEHKVNEVIEEVEQNYKTNSPDKETH